MINENTQWLVVTDLDGTLLNHHDYTVTAALPAINLLQKKNIPIILNTSKTYAETIAIRQELAINDPFIVENGSAIYLPRKDFKSVDTKQISHKPGIRDDYWEIIPGTEQSAISHALEQINIPADHYTRLSQITIEQAIQLTGLNEKQAANAIKREFSEPLIWNSDQFSLDLFKQALIAYQLTTLQGGRFLHVLGNSNKGQATQLLCKLYNKKIKTIVLGDSENDAAMLNTADISVIVKSPSNHQLEQLITPHLHTQSEAPEGWTEAINSVLDRIKNQE